MSADSVNTFCHYATQTELDYLRTLAARLPAGAQVVMLGAGPGVMAIAVKEGNPNALVWIVDHDTCEWAYKHLAASGFGPGIFLVVKDSVAEAPDWIDEQRYHFRSEVVDLLIIDADHSYEGVTRDMLAWLPHVALGGFVFFHDYSAAGTEFADQEQYPGVALAIGQYLPKNYTTEARVGTAIVFQKQ